MAFDLQILQETLDIIKSMRRSLTIASRELIAYSSR